MGGTSLCRQRLVALLDKSGGHHGCFAYCVVDKKASMSESGPIRPSKPTTKPNERCLRIRTGCIATVGGTQFAQFGGLRGPDWMGGTFSTGGWHLQGRQQLPVSPKCCRTGLLSDEQYGGWHLSGSGWHLSGRGDLVGWVAPFGDYLVRRSVRSVQGASRSLTLRVRKSMMSFCVAGASWPSR